jgi:hypothetical protein
MEYTVVTVRGSGTTERNGIDHMHARFKRSKGVKLDGILE